MLSPPGMQREHGLSQRERRGGLGGARGEGTHPHSHFSRAGLPPTHPPHIRSNSHGVKDASQKPEKQLESRMSLPASLWFHCGDRDVPSGEGPPAGGPSLSSPPKTVTVASPLPTPLRDTAAPETGDPDVGAPENLPATQSQVQETNGWDAPQKERFLSAWLSRGIKLFSVFRADLKVTLSYVV